VILNTATTNFKADALSDDQLKTAAPSIFANGPMTGLSSRYTFVPTTEIVAGLRARNWLPVDVEQQRVRTATRFGFQKHLIRFRRAEQMQNPCESNDLWTVFNRVGENLIRGGLTDHRRDRAGRLRTLRSLRGIDSKLTHTANPKPHNTVFHEPPIPSWAITSHER